MDNKQLRITVELVDKAEKGIDRIVKNLDRLDDKTESVGRGAKGAKGGFKEFVGGIISAKLAMRAFDTTVDLAKRGLKEFSNIVMEGASYAMMEESLQVIAANVGITADELEAMKQELFEINTTGSNATRVLQTFAQSGLTDLIDKVEFASGESGFKGFIETVKDFSATAQVSSTQGIQMFTTALGRNNIRMLESFGITQDLDALYREYKDTLGITNRQLTETEKRMALLNLIAKEGKDVQGVYNETYDNAAKNMLSLDDAVSTVRETLGSAFEPALAAVTNDLLDLVKGVRDWIIGTDEQEGHLEQLTEFVSKLATMFEFLTGRLSEAKGTADMTDVVIGFGKFAKAIAIVVQAGEVLVGELRIIADVLSMVGRLIRSLTMTAVNFFDSLARFDPARPFETAGGAVEGLRSSISTMRGQWDRDFEVLRKDVNLWDEDIRNIENLVRFDVADAWEQAGLDAKNSLKETRDVSKVVQENIGANIDKMSSKMADAITDYNEKVQKSFESYQDKLFDLVVTHRERIDDLKKSLKDERKLIDKESKEKKKDAQDEIDEVSATADEKISILEDEIQRERDANLMNEQQNIQFLQDQIRAIEDQRDERIRVIEDSLNEELQAIKDNHKEKISELEKELESEMEIQQKHSKDFAKFKDKEKEDDITRLKQKYKEEREEMAKEHQRRLQDLAKQGRQAGSVYGRNMLTGAREKTGGPAGFVNALVGGVEKLLGNVAKRIAATDFEGLIIKKISKFGEKATNIFKFQGGVQKATGGLALVGEQGPEIVNLPSGSSVTPTETSKEIIKETGSTSNTYNISVISDKFMGSKVEARQFAREIIDEIRSIASTKAIKPSNLLDNYNI